jgi:hypothetical protein
MAYRGCIFNARRRTVAASLAVLMPIPGATMKLASYVHEDGFLDPAHLHGYWSVYPRSDSDIKNEDRQGGTEE